MVKTSNRVEKPPKWVTIENNPYLCDSYYNLTPKILALIPKKLHNQPYHPLWLIKQRISQFFNQKYPGKAFGSDKSSKFTLFDNLPAVVTSHQNFDSLLVPHDHISRSSKDTYYLNEQTLLRSHTSAHQNELIASGINAFLVAGDVYRRDDIDCTHYPAFHQLEGVRLFSADQLFREAIDPSRSLQLLESLDKIKLTDIMQSSQLPPDKQFCHTYETLNKLEFKLKSILEDLAKHLFGQNIKIRWVEAYFPFTHPSWELEVSTEIGSDHEKWLETLGCGIIRQEILLKNGITNKVGYAFGLGLERWAMQLYKIPDIRLFWSTDSGFLSQFICKNIDENIVFKPISSHPQCPLDISFWLPSNDSYLQEKFSRDWYDIIREVAGDLVEQVLLVDSFTHPKTGKQSHCYRIVYRHHSKTLTLEEIRPIHERLGLVATEKLFVEVR